MPLTRQAGGRSWGAQTPQKGLKKFEASFDSERAFLFHEEEIAKNRLLPFRAFRPEAISAASGQAGIGLAFVARSSREAWGQMR